MPQRRNNTEPPPVMTWARAAPVLVVSAVFDAVSFMFDWFIFFGPALAAVTCTAVASGPLSTWTLGAFGTKTAAFACVNAAGVAGFFGAGVIESFGIIMAMVVSFAGWLVILIILLVFNQRIFKENALWFGGSLLMSEIPLLGSLPVITFVVWRMFSNQIRIETAAMAKWKKEQAEIQKREQGQQIAQMMQMQQAQLAEQEAANEALYEQAEAANDESTEEMREAA